MRMKKNLARSKNATPQRRSGPRAPFRPRQRNFYVDDEEDAVDEEYEEYDAECDAPYENDDQPAEDHAASDALSMPRMAQGCLAQDSKQEVEVEVEVSAFFIVLQLINFRVHCVQTPTEFPTFFPN